MVCLICDAGECRLVDDGDMEFYFCTVCGSETADAELARRNKKRYKQKQEQQ